MLRRLMPFAARVPIRTAAVALLVAAGLLGGWLWFRDSSLVRATDVYVLGLSSSQERAIRAALVDAAGDMTTLDVDVDRLKLAVARFPSVSGVRAQAKFPHKLTIEVVEREPVAAIELGGVRVPVGAGGLLMRGVRADDDLATLHARRLSPDSHLSDPRALASVSVLAAAPAPLRKRVDRAWWGSRGLTLDLRSGPQLVFGSDRAARVKWAAAARVLAEPSAAGAVYLDVRVPERVSAGGLQAVPAAVEANPNPQPQPQNESTLNP